MNTEKYGGCYVPETLIPAQKKLETCFQEAKDDPNFQESYTHVLNTFSGRSTPLTRAKQLEDYLGSGPIYLKREDLNHTGSHKINNALGQCLLAKRMNKQHIIAETGAGQHGVATATACAHLGMKCTVFMGEKDTERQKINVRKMKVLGARVIPVKQGSRTLKDAVSAALQAYSSSYKESHYCLGSALGPSPYPEIVAYFQSVIGREAKKQILKQAGELPQAVIACVGGGSNAIGIFQSFIQNDQVKLIGVEAGGKGLEQGQHASRFHNPKKGVLHGCLTYLIQNKHGQIESTDSIAAGLDYPSVGPAHAELYDSGRASYHSITDAEAKTGYQILSRLEGIIPALESAHAVGYLIKHHSDFDNNQSLLINISGRGEKDIERAYL